jgi:aryl-alcohol dehydrogenase-like predicted oxidoreductase
MSPQTIARAPALSALRPQRLQLPAVSLGLWQNFGYDHPLDTSRAIVRRAFDLGITMLADLATHDS